MTGTPGTVHLSNLAGPLAEPSRQRHTLERLGRPSHEEILWQPVQLVTVRWLGTFLEDPLDVPGAVLDFVAGQLGSRTRRR